jgi:alginate O-acetyltransferase complex protein AlgI
LREYVYIPLGGRGNSKLHYIVVILIVFTISGLWHGANANFVLWGFFNGLLFVVSILFGLTQKSKVKTYHWYDIFKILAVFISISFTRVLFYSTTLPQALAYYKNMFVFTNLSIPDIGLKALLFSVVVVIVEFLQRNRDNASDISHKPLVIRLLLYGIIIATILFLWPVINPTEYIYFKF